MKTATGYSIMFLKVDPMLDPLRADPRLALLAKLFPPGTTAAP